MWKQRPIYHNKVRVLSDIVTSSKDYYKRVGVRISQFLFGRNLLIRWLNSWFGAIITVCTSGLLTTATNVQDLYNVNFETLSWCQKHLQNAPIYCVFYFTETHWALVYKNKMRKQEKLERIRFFYD